MSEHDNTIQLIRDRFDEVGHRLGGIEGHLREQDTKLEDLDRKVTKQNGRVAENERVLADHLRDSERSQQRSFDAVWHRRHLLLRIVTAAVMVGSGGVAAYLIGLITGHAH